jgi:Pyruvate/2-oxoacid:ferredoxin oxidoreductase gamma subunit
MQSKRHISLIFTGRGGQGVLTVSSITAYALFLSGYDVKKSDIKGIARRGGRVISTLIAGKKVYDPKVALKTVDFAILLSDNPGLEFSEHTILIFPTEQEIEKFHRNINVFCLGKLSIFLDIPLGYWEQAIKDRFRDGMSCINLIAFYEGRKNEIRTPYTSLQ